jgi:hypothetical protein
LLHHFPLLAASQAILLDGSSLGLIIMYCLKQFKAHPLGYLHKIKKALYLFIWQSGLVFILITHGSPFLNDTHFALRLLVSGF